MANERLQDKSRAINNWIKTDLVFLFVLCLIYFFLQVFNETCPIKAIFSIECPTCGCTRAINSLLYLDFKGYFTFNPLALPLAVIIYMNLHAEYFNKFLLKIGTITVAVITFAVYLIKLIF